MCPKGLKKIERNGSPQRRRDTRGDNGESGGRSPLSPTDQRAAYNLYSASFLHDEDEDRRAQVYQEPVCVCVCLLLIYYNADIRLREICMPRLMTNNTDKDILGILAVRAFARYFRLFDFFSLSYTSTLILFLL